MYFWALVDKYSGSCTQVSSLHHHCRNMQGLTAGQRKQQNIEKDPVFLPSSRYERGHVFVGEGEIARERAIACLGHVA